MLRKRSGFVRRAPSRHSCERTPMRFCYNCGHITPGKPLFCNSCARSFDIKLCPRLHVNPRNAEACSQCGSRELSLPQPKIPFSWRLLASIAVIITGLVLGYFSLVVCLSVGSQLLTRPEMQGSFIALGLLFLCLWLIWSTLPEWFRKLFLRNLEKRKYENGKDRRH